MTQILPPDDAFAAGSPAYGGVATGFLPLYLGARLSSAAISSIWIPNGRAFIARPMHGGYQSTNSHGIHDYNAAFYDGGTGTVAHVDSLSPSGMMFRAPFAADVVVSGVFEMRALLGSATAAHLAPRGVFARAQAGTLVGDGGTDPEIRDLTCYFAVVYQKQGDAADQLRLGVYKCVGGAITLLASGESGAVSTIGLSLTSLVTITLNVTGTALFATVQGFGTTAVLRHPVSGTIADGSVAGAGRCGFFMGADREPAAGKKQVDLCHLLAVDEGGVRKLQDEFRRLSLAASKQTPTDAMGTVGSGYLTSAFYWDAATFDGSFVVGPKTYTGTRRLLRNATAGRVTLNHDVTDDDVNAGRLILSQRPADSRVSQHRTVTVVIPSTAALGTGEVWAGIVLRANQAQPLDENPPALFPQGPAGPNFATNGTFGTGGSGYMFIVRAVSNSSVIWSLKRIVNNAHFPIANLTEFSIFPGYGTSLQMDLDCFPRNSADPLGHVQLVCRVNGSLLAMALSNSAVTAGLLNPSTGVFVDNNGSRIQQNLGEGLVTANGFARTGTTSADIDPVFGDWTQGTLTNDVLLDRDQASVTVQGEGSAFGVALDTIIGPDWPFEVEYRYHSVSIPFESGHRQTMPRFQTRRTGYKFKKRGVKRTELDSLIGHWNSHNGLETPFNFTAPGDAAVKVHYVSDSLAYRMIEAGVWEVEFDLESLV